VIFTPLGGNGFRLVVEDDGRGLAKNSAPTGTGLGTQIIHAMTHSLGATLNQTNTGNGFRITLERPPT
jgi:two-component sensor histidine kinase